MIAESYVLNLQCDFCPPRQPKREQFSAPNSRDAHRFAKADGWRIYPAQMKAKCPKCATVGGTAK